jgi:hypothetical protein
MNDLLAILMLIGLLLNLLGFALCARVLRRARRMRHNAWARQARLDERDRHLRSRIRSLN